MTDAASNGADRGGNASWRTESIIRIVEGARQGNRQAQQQLYEEFKDKVLRLVVRMVGQQDAPDLVQQVFLQMFRKIGQYTGRAQFGTWLYRLAINECLQFRRRTRNSTYCTLPHEPIDELTSWSLQSENQELLGRALEGIDAGLRAIFLLREVEELSYSEIANVLQISEGTVGSRLNRARSSLREELIELGWEP
jgi:RNA polymerase sigma-70 factor (ECF subfamily)